jgi:hypothetical protein
MGLSLPGDYGGGVTPSQEEPPRSASKKSSFSFGRVDWQLAARNLPSAGITHGFVAQIVELQDGPHPHATPQAVGQNLRDFASFEKPIVVQCGKWLEFSVK